ncbi:MAG: alpha/beta hydrolase [Pseudomonadota bacterium]
MKRLSLACLSILSLSGCVAVPLVTIPTTNYLTTQYYEGKYEEYDQAYRSRVAFEEVAIPRDDYTLYARKFGSWKDDTRPIIVLMHGFPDSLHLYDELSPLLAADYRVLSFDFLGWGNSDKPRKHSYDTASLTADLNAVIDYLETPSLSLVVHDASGPPGIDWALNNPERMELLVLLNTFYHPMDQTVKPEAIETFSTPGLRRSISITGATISNVGFRIAYQNQLKRFLCDPVRVDTVVPALTYQALKIRRAFFQLNNVLDHEIAARSDAPSRLQDYPGQVLIVFGEEDPYLNIGMAREFDKLFSNSVLETVPLAAHFVQLDRPDVVADAILRQGLESASRPHMASVPLESWGCSASG